jgi:hypothetical protein
MKRSFVFVLVLSVFAVTVMAESVLSQQGGAPAGQRGQGGGPGGARGGRGAPPPPATGPIADQVNAIVDAINKQDTAFLTRALAPDAQWLDEDGHMPPASAWIPRILDGRPKKMTMTNLRVGQPTPDTGWAAFNYTLETPAGNITGLNSMLFRKNGNDWQAVLVHAAVNTKAVTPH